MIIDSHCHLNYPEFKDDLSEVLERAHQKGVTTLLTVNTRLSEVNELKRISENYSRVYFSVGVHPHEAKDYQTEDLSSDLKKFANHPKAIGIGETGLDYYYHHSSREEQIFCFHQHLQTSTDLDLPIIIHTRNADDDTLNCLNDHPKSKGVFHCFSGSQSLSIAALEKGFYLSFSGIITFKNADELRNIVRETPLDRILVETDSPYLAPLPYRGQRNEPAHTLINLKKIAEIKGLTMDEASHLTTQNFFKLFSKCSLDTCNLF